MTSPAGETASSTQKVVAPFPRNRWTNQLQNKTSYLVLRFSRDGAFSIFDKSSLKGQIFNRFLGEKINVLTKQIFVTFYQNPLCPVPRQSTNK